MCTTSISRAVLPSPELAAALDTLPGRKFIFTNGSRKHAEAVMARLGVTDHFEDICDIHALEYIHPKPMREAYERFSRAHDVVPHQAAMFDDLPHNLETAHQIGMTTVLVDGLTEHPEHQAMAGWIRAASAYSSPHRRAGAFPHRDRRVASGSRTAPSLADFTLPPRPHKLSFA